MRVEQLEYIRAVTRLGSLRRAAEELHLSQPALSETVRNLERELGVELLERRQSGAKISAAGKELLPYIETALEAVDRLRSAAGNYHRSARMIRVGTVNTATVPLLVPAVSRFRELHPRTPVEVVSAQQDDIHQSLREGSMDLGLVNYLRGDDYPPDFESTELLCGKPVVCIRADSSMAALREVGVDDLLASPLVMMRSGYVMHRFVHRLLGDRTPASSYTTDGAEMGKLMVAEGLGATILPDFSVINDPLERSGAITYRPLRSGGEDVLLVMQRRRSASTSQAMHDLHRMFVTRAHASQRSQRNQRGDRSSVITAG
ncbi:MAG TPA: LysR family transcriptional regulator [Streptosporangiaceae bacterium]|nr:LysR family transcriptional regulator [Streptosporangiaceae bacterium]